MPNDYSPEHVGWLLSSLATENIAKGERMLARLNDKDKAAAEKYCAQCVTEMAAACSDNELAAGEYARHSETRERIRAAISNNRL